jgi:hypothetical protein
MLEQFLFAYIGGVILVVGMEFGRMIKARRMNKAAQEAGLIAKAKARSESSEAAIQRNAVAPTAANQSQIVEPTRLAS